METNTMSPERQYQYFTRAEALAKVGKTVKSLVDFSGVPQGTLADVISADPTRSAKPPFVEAFEVFDVAVRWRFLLPPPVADLVVTGAGDSHIEIHSSRPLGDWFTKAG
jgi:hypothetical protein